MNCYSCRENRSVEDFAADMGAPKRRAALTSGLSTLRGVHRETTEGGAVGSYGSR
jgi:hypothetical protein